MGVLDNDVIRKHIYYSYEIFLSIVKSKKCFHQNLIKNVVEFGPNFAYGEETKDRNFPVVKIYYKIESRKEEVCLKKEL